MIRHEKRMLANKFVPKWLSGLSLREIETSYIIHVFLYFVPSFIGFLLSNVSHLSFCICWAPKFLVFWCLLLLRLFEHDIDGLKIIFHLKLKHFSICKITIFSMPLSTEKKYFCCCHSVLQRWCYKSTMKSHLLFYSSHFFFKYTFTMWNVSACNVSHF